MVKRFHFRKYYTQSDFHRIGFNSTYVLSCDVAFVHPLNAINWSIPLKLRRSLSLTEFKSSNWNLNKFIYRLNIYDSGVSFYLFAFVPQRCKVLLVTFVFGTHTQNSRSLDHTQTRCRSQSLSLLDFSLFKVSVRNSSINRAIALARNTIIMHHVQHCICWLCD